MIWTREEIALVMSPCAQHTRPLQQDVVSGCTHQERRMDHDLSWYRCLPPFIENCKAHDCLLWEPGGNKDLLPCWRKEVSMGLNSPFLGRGCGSACKEKEKEKDTHTGAVQGSGGGTEIRGCGPRSVELR